jgi:Zn-dependent peptidase ImmA (M78 family)
MDKSKLPRIVERKLGREKADGQAWVDDHLIEIDTRLDPERWLTVLIHELLHIAYPTMSEEEVERGGELVGSSCWKMGVRRTYQ